MGEVAIFISELIKLTDDDLERMFRLTYSLHPNMALVQKILPEACIAAARLYTLQERLPKDHGFYKLPLSTACLFQQGVYIASEHWERDQESSSPTKTPRYQPTSRDLRFRYVKLLIQETMARRSCYGAVGLGCFLYTYRPGDISRLFPVYDPDNIRFYKGKVLERIRDRFAGVEIVRGARNTLWVHTEPSQADERVWINKALLALIPWFPPTCISEPSIEAPPDDETKHSLAQAIVLWKAYFSIEADEAESLKNSDHEWVRIHTLIDPNCAGLARLVQAYNATLSRNATVKKLDTPEDRLGLPRLNASLPPDPPNDHGDRGPRFDPRPPSSTEIKDLRHSLSETLQRDLQRITAYRGGDLAVYVNGKAYGPLRREGDACAPCTIPLAASYVEIYGRDDDGELLLAVLPLPELDSVTDNHERHLVVRHEGGPTIDLAIQPVPADTGEIREFLLRITYEEAQQPAVSREAVSLGVRVAQWSQQTSQQAIEAITSAVQRVLSCSPLWHLPLAGEWAAAADIPSQEHIFQLDEGFIQVTCQWWAASQRQPATLWLAWKTDITLPGDLWVRFTRQDDTSAILDERPLGRAFSGERSWFASKPGETGPPDRSSRDVDPRHKPLRFDPMHEPWTMSLLVKASER